jgi:hypothetical protein
MYQFFTVAGDTFVNHVLVTLSDTNLAFSVLEDVRIGEPIPQSCVML